MKRLIIFLIRRRLKLREYELFQFTNQKTDNLYYFTESNLMRYEPKTMKSEPSNVKLNWLLDDECEVASKGYDK